MKKIGEMERNIRLCSSEIGYKSMLILLSVVVLLQLYQSFFYNINYNPILSIVLGVGIFSQYYSELLMKKKMTDGDSDFKEPNKFLHGSVFTVFVGIVILSIGYFLTNNN